MQQFLTSTEACGLLDRILASVQNLNATKASLFPSETNQVELMATAAAEEEREAPPETLIPPMMEEMPVLPAFERPVAPVLTIKLGDLLREGAAARERRAQHVRPPRPITRPPVIQRQTPRNLPPMREIRTIEVLYKRQRIAS
jgi:hypothetical protein